MTLAGPLQTEKQGYWADHKNHPYHRLNVQDYVEEFCGWKALTELIELIYDERQKAFFVTMFQTGGRVTEVLLLKKYNFNIMENEGIVKVTQMRLLKKYKKLDAYKDAEGKNRWHTQKFVKFRKTFTIQRREPSTPILEKYLKNIKDSNVYLFPSPFIHSKRYMKTHLPLPSNPENQCEVNKYVQDVVNGQVPYTPQWAYLIIREVNRHASTDLKERLGLKRPYLAKNGEKLSDEIHLWLHWFRSQRASQLVNDYGFEVMDLVDYFSWTDVETALRYAKKGWRGLTEKMNKAHVQYT